MGRAYRIKRYDHVSQSRQANLREQRLVPINDGYADNSISNIKVEFYIPQEGDWLIEFFDATNQFYLMKVKKYIFLPHKLLYAKHFCKISYSFLVDLQDTSPLFKKEILDKDHLVALSDESVFSLLPIYEKKIKIHEKRARNRTFKEKNIRRKKLVNAPQYSRSVHFTSSKNGPVIVKDGRSNVDDIDKQAILIFKSRFPYKVASPKHLNAIKKEILNKQNKKL